MHDTNLHPQAFYSARTFTFDFPETKIGIDEYEEEPIGCTFFKIPERVTAADAVAIITGFDR